MLKLKAGSSNVAKVCSKCNQEIKDRLQTLEEVYNERIRIIISTDLAIPTEETDKAFELLERLEFGRSLSLLEVAWINQTIEKYGLE